MSAARDYYAVLGVSRHADDDEIKRAHRKLARELHPDINKADDAAEKFAEVQRAYEVLSDAEKRKTYDRFGHAGVDASVQGGAASGWPGGARPGGTYTWSNVGGRPGQGGGGGDFSEFDVGSIFEEMFGGRPGGGGGFGTQAKRRSKPAKGRDMAREIEIDFLKAIRGGKESLRVRRGGSMQTIDVTIPKGATDGAKLRVRGAGAPSEGHAAPGDLILKLKVKPHPIFRRDGDDLTLDLPLTIVEATLGAKVSVPTLNGSVELTVPPGTPSGQRLRLRGQGVPKSKGSGDLYAVAQIVAPKKLPAEARKSLTKLGEKLKSPRKGPGWDAE